MVEQIRCQRLWGTPVSRLAETDVDMMLTSVAETAPKSEQSEEPELRNFRYRTGSAIPADSPPSLFTLRDAYPAGVNAWYV